MHAVGIVAAAGSGRRLGADRPKALVHLAGRPLVCWAVDTLRDGGVDEVVVVVPVDDHAAFAEVLPDGIRLVVGGATRTASVHAGLAAVGPEATAVLVHDAARPLTPPAVVGRVLDALADGALAVVPVLPVVDTVVVADEQGVVVAAPDRAVLRRVQTPQGFSRVVLAVAYDDLEEGLELTDDAAVVREIGIPVRTVAGDERSAKVTVPHDLRLAELQVTW